MITQALPVSLGSFVFWNLLEWTLGHFNLVPYFKKTTTINWRRRRGMEHTDGENVVPPPPPFTKEQLDRVKYMHTIISLVHSLIAFLAALIAILVAGETDVAERVFGGTDPVPPIQWVPIAWSLGYFAWDLVTCIRWLSTSLYEPVFILHALVCSLGFIVGLWPFSIYYTIRYLIFEGSTVIVNLRWMRIQHCRNRINNPSTTTTSTRSRRPKLGKLDMLINAALYLSFFILRILYGSMTTVQFTRDMLDTWYAGGECCWVRRGFCILSSSLVALSCCMNYYWFGSMTRMIYRMFYGTTTTTTTKQHSS